MNLNTSYAIKMSSKADKALRAIAKEDKKLFAEIIQKIKLLESGKFEQLDIESIKRSKEKYKIKEIRIFHPGSYRIFYIHINNECNEILIVDGQRKKVDKFNSNYFKTLDKCIENELIYINEK